MWIKLKCNYWEEYEFRYWTKIPTAVENIFNINTIFYIKYWNNTHKRDYFKTYYICA